MNSKAPIRMEVRRAMTTAFAADGILTYGAVDTTGNWFVSRDRKERSISLAENRRAYPTAKWRTVAMRDWVLWDYYRELRGEQ